MSEKKGYNGWSNYETWNVKLWMDNDEYSYRRYEEMAQEAYDDAESDETFSREDNAALSLSKTLRSEYEDALNDILENARISASVWSDLLTSALGEVDWYEIAESLLSNVEKEKDDDDGEVEDE